MGNILQTLPYCCGMPQYTINRPEQAGDPWPKTPWSSAAERARLFILSSVHVSHENQHTVPNLRTHCKKNGGGGVFPSRFWNGSIEPQNQRRRSSSLGLHRGTFYILPSRHEDGLMNIRYFLGGKGGAVRRAELTTFMCRLSWNLGTSTSWNPQGLSRPVMGLLYFYLFNQYKTRHVVFISQIPQKIFCLRTNTIRDAHTAFRGKQKWL